MFAFKTFSPFFITPEGSANREALGKTQSYVRVPQFRFVDYVFHVLSIRSLWSI